jgi:hypothetical protein
MLTLALSACGGGSGVASSPPPAPAPAPAPAPTPAPTSAPSSSPTPRASLVAPIQTANPASPIADAGGAGFRNPAANTTFPLLQTAVDADFGGDQATTNQGATLNLDRATNRWGLTLNNETLDIVDATATTADHLVDGIHEFGAPISGGRNLQVMMKTLDYTVYGYWSIDTEPSNGTSASTNGGAWLGGYLTPSAAIPTSGSATYAGHVTGLYDLGSQSQALIIGDVQINADFGAQSVSGAMTHLQASDILPSALNDIAFSASLDPSRNQFRGTTRVTSMPGGPYTFSANAAGTIAGRFFGPNANEVGGVWTLSDDGHRLIGSFGAGRN